MSKKKQKLDARQITVTSKIYTLNGTDSLSMSNITSIFSVEQVINPRNGFVVSSPNKTLLKKNVQTESYPLHKTNAEDLLQRRIKKLPTFVLKEGAEIFYADIPVDIGFISSLLGEHKCNFCRRLSAASDQNGGCEKVRNCARFVEHYPWIPKAYETFGTTHDAFVVSECEHLEHQLSRPKSSLY